MLQTIPQSDRGSEQRKPTAAVTLVFKTTIPYFSRTMHEDSSGKGIPGFPFVQTCLNPTTKLRVALSTLHIPDDIEYSCPGTEYRLHSRQG